MGKHNFAELVPEKSLNKNTAAATTKINNKFWGRNLSSKFAAAHDLKCPVFNKKTIFIHVTKGKSK